MLSQKRKMDSDGGEMKMEGSEYTFQITDRRNYEEKSIFDIAGKVCYGGKEVGSLDGFLFPRKNKSKGWYSKCDALSSETQECSVLFFEDNGTLQTEFAAKVSAQCNTGGFLHVTSVKIDEGHRGKDLGVLLFKKCLDYLTDRWTLAMMQPYPLRETGGAEAFAAAILKISRYFARLGFIQCSDNGFSSQAKFWYLDAAHYTGELQPRDAVRDLNVAVAAAEPPTSDATKEMKDLIVEMLNDPLFSTTLSPDFKTKLQALLARGGDLNAANALQMVVANGKLHLVDTLLELGANVNGQDYDGNTALHVAAAIMNPEAVAKLLHCGADKTIQDKRNDTPLKALKNVQKTMKQFQTCMGLPDQASWESGADSCARLLR